MSLIESFEVIIKTGALEEGYTPDPPNPHEEHDGTEEDERPAGLDDGCDYLPGGARWDVGDTLARGGQPGDSLPRGVPEEPEGSIQPDQGEAGMGFPTLAE